MRGPDRRRGGQRPGDRCHKHSPGFPACHEAGRPRLHGRRNTPPYRFSSGGRQVHHSHAAPQQALVKGESKSSSIAAASIIAKVTRDRIMAGYHETYPVYNFLKNKGYPTRDHRRAIAEHGPCPIHRRSFKGVREFSDPDQQRPTPCQRDLW
nr:hypothetical protein [Desulfolithobacter dissulfuricans]